MKTTVDVMASHAARFRCRDGPTRWLRSTLLRAAVSLALIAWLLYRVDWQETGTVFRRAQPGFLLLALLMLFLERTLAVWKWWLLMRGRRLPVGFWSLFGINYAGSFLGMFIPSSVSADVVRENAFVALFSAAGLMTVADAFAVSFTMTVLVALTSLPGAAFYFRGIRARRDSNAVAD